MVNLANGFARRNFEVDLLLVRREGVYLSQLSPAVNLIDLKTGKLLLSLPKLVAYLRRTRPDLLLSALEDTNIVAIASNLIARALGNPATQTIVTVHNHLSQESQRDEGLKRRFVPKLLRWIYPFADSVVAVSRGVAADLVQLGIQPHQVRVIYNPILTPDFETLAAAELSPGKAFEQVCEWLSVGGAALKENRPIPIILGVGRLVKQKDFETLIQAFARARDVRSLRLLILGEGSEQAKLEQLVQQLGVAESVIFTGFVDNPLTYMASADLCVSSSAWEGFGNILVEAMGVGTPVVSTDSPSGPTEILAGGTYGPLVAVGDVAGLAAAILATLAQPLPADLLKRRAADFSVEAIVDEYEKLLA